MSIAPFSRVDRDAMGRIVRVVPLVFVPAGSVPTLNAALMRWRDARK